MSDRFTFDDGDRIHLHNLLTRLDKKEPKPPKECGKGWTGTKPPGCKRAQAKGKTKSKTVKGILEGDDPRNAIVKSGLSDRRNALSTLKGQQLELKRLGELANEAIANQAEQEESDRVINKFKDALREIKKMGEETEAIRQEVKKTKRDRLTRAMTGKIDRVYAKTADLYKRIYETANPRKLVRFPKGTSQADYYAIMQAISQGDKKAIAQYTVKKPPKSKKPKKTKPKKDSINFDSFDDGDRIHLHELLSLLDRRDATPCGKGWTGTKPPGCKRASAGSKSKTVKAEPKSKNVKPKAEPKTPKQPKGTKQPKATEPSKQSGRSPLPKNHTVSSDSRITADTIDKLFDGLDTPGASDRINALRQILNKQGIQAVFNDKASKKRNKNKAIFDQIEQDLISTSPERKELISKIKAEVEQLESTNDPSAKPYRKLLETTEKKIVDYFVGTYANAQGYTAKEFKHIVVATNSKGSKDFKADPSLLKSAVQTAVTRQDYSIKQWSMSDTAKYQSPETAAAITYLHESGHQVQYAAESTGKLKMPVKSAKAKFKSLTEYSETNDKEWFAEHFTAWTLDADSYREFDPDGSDYIEKAVKLAQSAKRRIL